MWQTNNAHDNTHVSIRELSGREMAETQVLNIEQDRGDQEKDLALLEASTFL